MKMVVVISEFVFTNTDVVLSFQGKMDMEMEISVSK
jgi:hypothetical protein